MSLSVWVTCPVCGNQLCVFILPSRIAALFGASRETLDYFERLAAGWHDYLASQTQIEAATRQAQFVDGRLAETAICAKCSSTVDFLASFRERAEKHMRMN